MANLNALYRELRQYRGLLDDVSASKRLLDRAVDSSEGVNKLGVYFSIDNTPADYSKLRTGHDTLVHDRDVVVSQIIPGINSKIRSIERAIEDEERRQREEQERLLAES